MSVGRAHKRQEPCDRVHHTIDTEVAVEVVWRPDGVENLDVMAGHVEVTEREILRTKRQKRRGFQDGNVCRTVMVVVCTSAAITLDCPRTRRCRCNADGGRRQGRRPRLIASNLRD